MPHSYSTELYHHGILGMKHGHRNGPPYPLQSSKLSSAEKSKGAKESKWADGTPKGYKPKKKSISDTINSAKKDYYKAKTQASKAKLKKLNEKKKVVSEREKAIAQKHEAKLAKQDLKYARKYERQAKKLQKLQDKNELKAKKEQYKYNKRLLKKKDISELSIDELKKNSDLYSDEEVARRINEINRQQTLSQISDAQFNEGVQKVKNILGAVNTGIQVYDTYAMLTGHETVKQRGQRLLNQRMNDKYGAQEKRDAQRKSEEERVKKRQAAIDDAETKFFTNKRTQELNDEYNRNETNSIIKAYANNEKKYTDRDKDTGISEKEEQYHKYLNTLSREGFERQVALNKMNSDDIAYYMTNVAHKTNNNGGNQFKVSNPNENKGNNGGNQNNGGGNNGGTQNNGGGNNGAYNDIEQQLRKYQNGNH